MTYTRALRRAPANLPPPRAGPSHGTGVVRSPLIYSVVLCFSERFPLHRPHTDYSRPTESEIPASSATRAGSERSLCPLALAYRCAVAARICWGLCCRESRVSCDSSMDSSERVAFRRSVVCVVCTYIEFISIGPARPGGLVRARRCTSALAGGGCAVVGRQPSIASPRARPGSSAGTLGFSCSMRDPCERICLEARIGQLSSAAFRLSSQNFQHPIENA